MSSQVVFVKVLGGGGHPVRLLQLQSVHGHKRKERPHPYSLLLASPLPLIPLLPSFPLLLITTPFGYFRPLPPSIPSLGPPTPPPSQASPPLPSPAASPSVTPFPIPACPPFASIDYFSLLSSCLLPLSFPRTLNLPSWLSPLPFPSPFRPSSKMLQIPAHKIPNDYHHTPTSIKAFLPFLKLLSSPDTQKKKIRVPFIGKTTYLWCLVQKTDKKFVITWWLHSFISLLTILLLNPT